MAGPDDGQAGANADARTHRGTPMAADRVIAITSSSAPSTARRTMQQNAETALALCEDAFCRRDWVAFDQWLRTYWAIARCGPQDRVVPRRAPEAG